MLAFEKGRARSQPESRADALEIVELGTTMRQG